MSKHSLPDSGDGSNVHVGALLDFTPIFDEIRDLRGLVVDLLRQADRPPRLFHSRCETAEILGLKSPSTVDLLRSAGLLKASTVGTALRFHIDDIAAFAQSRRGAAPFDLRAAVDAARARGPPHTA
jgi:hypothetical protein